MLARCFPELGHRIMGQLGGTILSSLPHGSTMYFGQATAPQLNDCGSKRQQLASIRKLQSLSFLLSHPKIFASPVVGLFSALSWKRNALTGNGKCASCNIYGGSNTPGPLKNRQNRTIGRRNKKIHQKRIWRVKNCHRVQIENEIEMPRRDLIKFLASRDKQRVAKKCPQTPNT